MGEELAVPGTGELVNLEDEHQCIAALSALRDFEQIVREAKSALTNAIIERSRVLGTKTIEVPGGFKAEVRGGPETIYDASEIEEKLRQLGMPEERISEIVVPKVEYRVNAREAKRAAAANEDYAAVIEGAKTLEEKPHYVVIKRER